MTRNQKITAVEIVLIHAVLTVVFAFTVPYLMEGIPFSEWGEFGALHDETFWANMIQAYGAFGWLISVFAVIGFTRLTAKIFRVKATR